MRSVSIAASSPSAALHAEASAVSGDSSAANPRKRSAPAAPEAALPSGKRRAVSAAASASMPPQSGAISSSSDSIEPNCLAQQPRKASPFNLAQLAPELMAQWVIPKLLPSSCRSFFEACPEAGLGLTPEQRKTIDHQTDMDALSKQAIEVQSLSEFKSVLLSIQALPLPNQFKPLFLLGQRIKKMEIPDDFMAASAGFSSAVNTVSNYYFCQALSSFDDHDKIKVLNDFLKEGADDVSKSKLTTDDDFESCAAAQKTSLQKVKSELYQLALEDAGEQLKNYPGPALEKQLAQEYAVDLVSLVQLKNNV
jgi:hypothetical protein